MRKEDIGRNEDRKKEQRYIPLLAVTKKGRIKGRSG